MTHVLDVDIAGISAQKVPLSGIFERWKTAELCIMQKNLLFVFFARPVLEPVR